MAGKAAQVAVRRSGEAAEIQGAAARKTYYRNTGCKHTSRPPACEGNGLELPIRSGKCFRGQAQHARHPDQFIQNMSRGEPKFSSKQLPPLVESMPIWPKLTSQKSSPAPTRDTAVGVSIIRRRPERQLKHRKSRPLWSIPSNSCRARASAVRENCDFTRAYNNETIHLDRRRKFRVLICRRRIGFHRQRAQPRR